MLFILKEKKTGFPPIIKWSAPKKKVLSIHNLKSTVREIRKKWHSQIRNMYSGGGGGVGAAAKVFFRE